jgi:hypothetical protein
MLGITAARASTVAGDLLEGRARLFGALAVAEEHGLDLTLSEASEIGVELQEADTALDRAASGLNGDPFLVWLRHIPIADRQVLAADRMIAAARGLTRRHAAISDLMRRLIAARDSGGGAERLAALARVTDDQLAEIKGILDAFDATDQVVSEVPADGLVGPIADARAAFATRLDQLRPVIAAARQGVALVPSVMGIGGEKRYLVLALDNAEIRPIGGLIAAFATPRLNDGLIADMTFRDILSVDRPDQRAYVPPPEPLADHLLGPITWQVADAGWWPDFAANAREARRMYEIETGDGDFQGAIAFTPEFVDELLKIVGPVEIPEAGITVDPGETYLVSLEQVEVLKRGEGRKQFLADLASRVLERLFALPASRYPEVLAALDVAGRRRDLQVLLDDPFAQGALARQGWYAPFTFDDKADRLAIMEANVAPVSKLDVLLDLDHELFVDLQPDGSAQERLITTYTNRYGPALAPELERVRSSFSFGNLGSYQRRYLDPAADVLSVTSDDRDVPITGPDSLDVESGSLAVGNYQFVRPGRVRLVTTYTTPDIVVSVGGDSASKGLYRLEFRKQPGRNDDSLRVVVRVPDGTVPSAWSEGGMIDDSVVTFSVTTQTDRTFEVAYAPR